MELDSLDGDLEILIDYSDKPTVALRGEVDCRNRERIKQAIFSLVDRGKASINVDLRGLEFMDTTGVSALVDAANAIAPSGGHVNLVTSGAQLAKVLSRCGVSGVFTYEQVSVAHPAQECPILPESRDVIEFEVPGQPGMLHYMRKRAAEFACSMPFTDDDIEDIKLAVGEAGSNAIRYGASNDRHKICVRLERHKNAMKIFITDCGSGFDPDSVYVPKIGELAEGGRGIMFMRALMDEVMFHFDQPGTRVELIKHFRIS
ncbi:MAG: anti-sigma factor antagonist [Armatimonadota bacterium]